MSKADKPQDRRHRTSWLQGLCALLGGAVTIAAIVILAHAALSDPEPAAISVRLEGSDIQSGALLATVRVSNTGDKAAAAVTIEGRAADHRSNVTLDYVPGKGVKRALLVFPAGVSPSEVDLLVLGWSNP